MKKILVMLMVLLAGCAATIPLDQHQALSARYEDSVKEIQSLQTQLNAMQPSAETLALWKEFEKYVQEDWGPGLARGLSEAAEAEVVLEPMEYAAVDNLDFVMLSLKIIVGSNETANACAFFRRTPLNSWVPIGLQVTQVKKAPLLLQGP